MELYILFAPENHYKNTYLLEHLDKNLPHSTKIEHHIFPNISHIHYGKIAKIVKETAVECNLPYYEYKNMRSAIIAHFKHLKDLGMKPELT